MTTPAVEKSLDASIKDGGAFAVMAGLGDPAYIGAGALLLGASESQVALLVTVPAFLGSCTQLLSPALIRRFGSRKTVFVGGSFVQALAWLAILGAFAVPPGAGYALLMAGFVLSFAGLHVGVPAWTSLMGELVPSDRRGRFFGARNAACFILQLAAMILAGATLAVYRRSSGREALGFIVIFAGACLARFLSVFWLRRMEEPAYRERDEDQFTFWQFIRRLPESNFARFAVFVGFFNAAAHLAGCLFIPYWRETLRFTYLEYMAVVSTVMFAQSVGLPFWGRIADRFGNRRILATTSSVIAFLPLLWMASPTFGWCLAMQVTSGFFWSGFNQSVANFLLDAVSPGKRARCTAYLNVVLNSGMLLGGLAGSWLISRVPVQWGPFSLPFAFFTVLTLSFLLRLTVVALFVPRFREVREVPAVGTLDMLLYAGRGHEDSSMNLLAPPKDDPGQPKP